MDAKSFKSGAQRFLVALLLGATLANILMLWGCCLSTYVDPQVHPRLSLAGLAFPFFLLADVGFFLLWLVFYVRLSWVPLLGGLLCFSFIRDYFPINIPHETPDSTICVLTYNVGYLSHDGADVDSARAEVRRFLVESNADIICLQECWSFKDCDSVLHYMEDAGYEHQRNGGAVIFSRLPFVGDTIPLHYRSDTNRGIAVRLAYEGDTLLLVNNHFESNHLSLDEKEEYRDMIESPSRSKIESSMDMVLGKLSSSAPNRACQTDSVVSLISSYDQGSVIVMGDFNDTPISYAYQRMSRHLDNAWRHSGNGLGWTFNQKGFFVRIDHIFHSDEWESYQSRIVTEMGASDHYPMLTHLLKVNKKGAQ